MWAVLNKLGSHSFKVKQFVSQTWASRGVMIMLFTYERSSSWSVIELSPSSSNMKTSNWKCKAIMGTLTVKLMRTLRAQQMLGQRTQMGNLPGRKLTSKKPWTNVELNQVFKDSQMKILSFILLNCQNKKCSMYLILQSHSDLVHLDIAGIVQKCLHLWKAIWQDY